jgi:hypothetical protein
MRIKTADEPSRPFPPESNRGRARVDAATTGCPYPKAPQTNRICAWLRPDRWARPPGRSTPEEAGLPANPAGEQGRPRPREVGYSLSAAV